MTIAFIADLHLTPQRPASSMWFDRFMNTTGQMISELYILGDLFEYWVGDDASDQLGHKQTEAAIRAVADCGTEIYFIHGNRDFLVGQDFAQRTGCKLLPDPSVITLDGLQVVLSHGDYLCTDDVEHQKARSQMLTSKWKMAFLENPIDARIDTAESLRRQSEGEKKRKSMEIMDVNQGEVEKLMRQQDADILIHGHTHRPGVHQFNIDGKKKTRYVVGDWYTQNSALIYENQCFMLKA